MTYATRTDLIARYGADEVSQREAMLGAGAADRALADADTEIESYLDARYVVPLTQIPGVIIKRACDIARYNLLGDAVTDDARARYKDAIAFLAAIAQGDLNLDGVTPKAGGGASSRVELVSARKVFGNPL